MPVIETSEQATFPGGVYRHRESGEELVAVETSSFGNPMAAAFVRMGFEFVGPLSEKAIAKPEQGDPGKLTLPSDPNKLPEFNVASPQESAGALEARLEAAKARDADAKKRAEGQASLAAEEKKAQPKADKKGGNL